MNGVGGVRPAGARWGSLRQWRVYAFFVVAHAAGGVLMHKVPAFATLHALATVIGVLAVAVAARRSSDLLIAASYVAGSEVMWRMCAAFIFYEVGKYAIAAIFLIGMWRMRTARLPGPALLYFALLLPAVVAPFFLFSLDSFRQVVSSNLAGPLLLTLGVCFCSNVRVNEDEIWLIPPVISLPLAGVAAITVFTTYTQDSIKFTTESNMTTSGGFGPNQVASALAFGAILLILYVLYRRATGILAYICVALILLFTAQGAMTFSRGGLMSEVITLAVISPGLVARRRVRGMLVGALVVLVLVTPVIYTWLDTFTGGKITARFTETKLGGRENIAQQDLEMFKNAPVFGVGVGVSRFGHTRLRSAHTEFTRCLAEHGSLGLVAIVIVLFYSLRPLFSIRPALRALRPVFVAMGIWALLYFVVNAMRLSLPSFAIALAALGSAKLPVMNKPAYGADHAVAIDFAYR